MSKQSNHTAAPWTVEKWIGHYHLYGESMHIADLGAYAKNSRQDANARLIAAAPDLLEALEELVEFAAREMGLEPAECISGQIGRARAAIAKAKGE